jgi:hypothetical protein
MNSSKLTNTKLQRKDGHGAILIISHPNKRNGSWIEDVLGRRLKLDLEMLFSGIQGVCTMVLLLKVIDLGSLHVCPLPPSPNPFFYMLIGRRLLQTRWSYHSRVLGLEEGSNEESLVNFPRSPPFQTYRKCIPRPRRRGRDCGS